MHANSNADWQTCTHIEFTFSRKPSRRDKGRDFRAIVYFDCDCAKCCIDDCSIDVRCVHRRIVNIPVGPVLVREGDC